jgi:hypothetical protein
LVAHLHFLPTQKAKQKNAKELPSQRTKTLQTMDNRATTDRTPAPNSGSCCTTLQKNKLFKIIIKTNLFRSDFKEVVFLVVT